MTASEYQNKISSLLNDLADTFEEISSVLNEMVRLKVHQDAFKKLPLNEAESKLSNLKKELKDLIDSLWEILDDIDRSIKSNTSFEKTETISNDIMSVLEVAREAWRNYNRAKRENLLDNEIVSNKKSILASLEKLSKKIVEYNEKFTPKLQSLETMIKLVEDFEKESFIQFYEEVLHKPYTKE